jgi:hypothetical protein
MSFRAFLAASRPELARPEAVHPAFLQTQQVATALDEIRFDVDAYDFAWQITSLAGASLGQCTNTPGSAR